MFKNLSMQVVVRRYDGGLDYEDIYVFGYKDVLVVVNYVQLSLKFVGVNMFDFVFESIKLEFIFLYFIVILFGILWLLFVCFFILVNFFWIVIIMKFFILCLVIVLEKFCKLWC